MSEKFPVTATENAKEVEVGLAALDAIIPELEHRIQQAFERAAERAMAYLLGADDPEATILNFPRKPLPKGLPKL